jgi:hypothetical protein
MKVKTRATTTKAEKSSSLMIPAERPTLRTMISTRLISAGFFEVGLPFARHQHSDGTALSPRVAEPVGDSTASDELSSPTHDNKENDVTPDQASIEETHVGVESREDKVLHVSEGLGRRVNNSRQARTKR